MIRFTPRGDEVGARTDAVLARRGGVSRSVAQGAVASGAVLVDGHRVRPGHRLTAEEVIEGTLPVVREVPPAAEDIPLAVRYSDDRILVVSKPAGVVTHPSGGHRSGTLVNALLGLGVTLSDEGSQRPGIVHRLDRDTSGLLLVARDDGAHAALAAALRGRRVERSYLALVRGRPAAASGTVDAPIARHPSRRTVMAVAPGGRTAVTHYRVLEEAQRISLLEVKLDTGRTHQIRVHLSYIGHPVLGDPAYGGVSELSRGLGLERPFLHAWRLKCPHPDDGTIEVRDELPEDLLEALAAGGMAVPGAPES